MRYPSTYNGPLLLLSLFFCHSTQRHTHKHNKIVESCFNSPVYASACPLACSYIFVFFLFTTRTPSSPTPHPRPFLCHTRSTALWTSYGAAPTATRINEISRGESVHTPSFPLSLRLSFSQAPARWGNSDTRWWSQGLPYDRS